MKVAFPCWENRIAPLLDSAREICVVEVESGRIVQEGREPLTGDLPVQKALRLTELGVATLVCGAISRPLQEMLAGFGIRVVSFVSGDLSDVIEAWMLGRLQRGVFAMPGCSGGRCRRLRGLHSRGREGKAMNGVGQDGRDMRGGQGRGQGGRRAGRGGGPLAAGPEGHCVCPQCGRREPHLRGVPCLGRNCPQCGAKMIRE